jgi:hypothetical protein
MEVTLSTGRKFNIEALNVTQTVEAVRLTRSIPKAEAGSFETMRYLVRSQRDVINWALGNAGAYPDVAEKITGTMRLDEMTEILRHIQSLTMLAQGSASRLVQ